MSRRVGLCCGSCGDGDRLFSDEVASILYPVRFTEEVGLPGTRELKYLALHSLRYRTVVEHPRLEHRSV